MITLLTYWGRVTHICVAYLTTIASDNGLSPRRRQAIIWTNAGILLIRRLGTNYSEILIEIHTFSFKKMHLKMSSAKRRPFLVLANWLLVLLSQSWSCGFNPRLVLDNSSVPLWLICISLCQSIKITPTNLYIAKARALFKINPHMCWN